jgi:valyl-tRNA synthetase
MSKSKGNVLDPIDLIDGIDLDALIQKRTTGLMQPQLKPKIEKATRKHFPDGIPEFGTDALRFTFAALASNGRDVRFDMGRIEGYRNFCNKIWNAARFVLMNVDEQLAPADPQHYSLPDRWIRSRLGKTIAESRDHIEHYRLDLAAKSLYEFTWNEYCDWYLELTKPLLQSDDTPAEVKAATQRTLIEVLETLLRTLHPIIPFITEEVWQRVAPVAGIEGDTIMLQPFPEATDFASDDQAEQELDWIMGFVLGIRQIRGEMDISPGKPLTVLLQDVAPADHELFKQHQLYISKLARLENIRILDKAEEAPTSATALLGGMQILVPMAGLIDVAAERERLQKRRDKAAAELAKIEAKLSNASFVDRAPEAVVAKERDRQEGLQRDLTQFDAQITKLAELE